MTNFGLFDWYMQAKRGQVAGVTAVTKFGSITSLGTTLTPVSSSGFFRTPTAATALEIVSTSTNDTNTAGTGGRVVTIEGIDSSYNAISQTANLNGTTPVALSADLLRINRAFVSSSGTYADQSTASHNGTITIQETGGGGMYG